MKMKVLFSTVVAVLLSMSMSNEASAQICGPGGGGYYRGGGYGGYGGFGGPRVVIAVRPPVPVYGYRAYPRYRNYGYRNSCGRGHRGCNDRVCYNGGGYRRSDRYDRNYRNDGYDNGYRRDYDRY